MDGDVDYSICNYRLEGGGGLRHAATVCYDEPGPGESGVVSDCATIIYKFASITLSAIQ